MKGLTLDAAGWDSGQSSKVTSADGTPIAYQRSGEGPPVILVGGAFNDARSSAPLASALAPQITAITYDRRGRGASGDTSPYAIAREVEDIAALIAEAGGQAGVCGHSSGSVLCFEAVAAGLPITRLAMFEPPYRPPGGPAAPPDYLDRMIELTTTGRNGEAVEYFMTQGVGLSADVVAQMRNAPHWPTLEALAPSAVHDIYLVGDGSVPVTRLAALTVPTLVLDSTGSAPWLRKAAAATADAVPNATHRSLTGSFHQIPPETLAPVLTEFFLP
jgi:pimeloyl-ACP methyl ester carboxylesterase